jgi:hypothetical protein
MTLEQVSQNLSAPVGFAALPAKVLQWNFENNLEDASGNGNHGTPAGDVSFVPGRFGKALSRTAGVLVMKKVAARVPLKATAPWSMNVWLGASDVPGWSQICGFQDASSQWGSVRFVTNDRGFNFWAHNSSLTSGVEFPLDGKWHMYTLVWTGSRARMFVDGRLVKVGRPRTADFSGLADIAQANVVIGDANTRWIGGVDEFTIWDGALDEEHVKRLFATNRIESPPSPGPKE